MGAGDSTAQPQAGLYPGAGGLREPGSHSEKQTQPVMALAFCQRTHRSSKFTPPVPRDLRPSSDRLREIKANA